VHVKSSSFGTSFDMHNGARWRSPPWCSVLARPVKHVWIVHVKSSSFGTSFDMHNGAHRRELVVGAWQRWCPTPPWCSLALIAVVGVLVLELFLSLAALLSLHPIPMYTSSTTILLATGSSVMTNEADFDKTIDEIFDYFDQLDKIPLTVLMQYLKRKHGLIVNTTNKPTSNKPAFKISQEFIETYTQNNVVYEFPKWYGYDKKKQIKFALDKRSEKAKWWQTKLETKSDFQKLFDEMEKRGVIREKTTESTVA
jgi:hypothetical protein